MRETMLVGYFDESGHESTHCLLVMGGLVGMEGDWREFEAEWAELLRKADLPYFHASKMNVGLGPLCKDWTRPQMADFMERAVSAVLVRDLLGLAVAVDLEAYAEVVGANEWLAKRLVGPYRLCYQFCIQTTHKWITRNPNCAGQKAVLVFSDNAAEGGALAQGLKYVDVEPWSDTIADVRSGSMRDILPLQAADLMAYETFKYWNEQFFGDQDRSARIPFRRFWGDGAMAPLRLFDAEALFNVCATIAMKEQAREAIAHLIRVGESLDDIGRRSYDRWSSDAESGSAGEPSGSG